MLPFWSLEGAEIRQVAVFLEDKLTFLNISQGLPAPVSPRLYFERV
ncbi:MAG: Unknown protein [uncultured Thiotrichaceae bacterium]|uniref:Uncharacterized protein n=1 Tax=uncultured Thiotrichaceae bacterium TaxID=298394 RepID=A0A6S6U5Q8_9GAMM|nr:MAG: Unknown protein [uncultured Thiotrichaceae bacterium]